MLSDDVDSSHHAVVLVLDVVAVEQIATSVPAPAHDDLHLFAIVNCDRIFPATFLTERLPPVPGQHLERHKMGVNGMQHGSSQESAIDKAPYLDVSEPGIRIDAKRIEGLAIDFPAYAWWGGHGWLATEDERAGAGGLGAAERLECTQTVGDATVVARRSDDIETHNGAGDVSVPSVLKDDLAANRINREVHDELDAFRRRQCDSRQHDWFRQQSLISGNEHERLGCELSASRMAVALEAFRIRKRYLRAATSMTGHGAPLTSKTRRPVTP